MNRNIQCLRKTYFVLSVFDGTLLRDNRPPGPAWGGWIQLRHLVLPAPERGSQGRQEGCPACTGEARGSSCWINCRWHMGVVLVPPTSTCASFPA